MNQEFIFKFNCLENVEVLTFNVNCLDEELTNKLIENIKKLKKLMIIIIFIKFIIIIYFYIYIFFIFFIFFF